MVCSMMAMAIIARPIDSLYSKLCQTLKMGLGPFSVWRIAGIVQEECVLVHLCQPRAAEDEVGWFLVLEWWSRSRVSYANSCHLE